MSEVKHGSVPLSQIEKTDHTDHVQRLHRDEAHNQSSELVLPC